jgi:predicted transcriptional regulator
MTIQEIATEYGVSETTARRKMKGCTGKKKKGDDGKASVDYKIGDVKAAFKPAKRAKG